jgi:hypothetical protein
LVHSELPRDYEVCPVCDWEVNPDQLRWPDSRDGPNGSANLIEEQASFQARVAEAQHRGYELPGLDLPLDPGWRPIDLAVDSFEPCGVQECPYPEDQTLLYWWRPTFWRSQRQTPPS